MAAIDEFDGKAEGTLSVADAEKLASSLKLTFDASLADDGRVTNDAFYLWVKASGKASLEAVPSGASFKEHQWADWKAWWEMRIKWDEYDSAGTELMTKDTMVKMSGSLEGLVKWEVSEMQADAEQNVSFEEFSSWWNMRRKFDRMDTDNSDTLDRVEMVEMARGLGIVDFEVADMDLDSDGNVPFDEFVAWWRMRCMFMKFDVSGEGHLSRAEVQQLSRELGIQISVRSMDVDGDDCIDFSEFSAWWHMRHKYDKFDDDKTGQLTYEQADKLGASIGGVTVSFEDMDEDGDGFVDFKEFTDWYKMRRCFDKIDISGDGSLDHDEIKRLAYMLNMDLKIEDIDKDGDGDVDFSEFQKWWSGNKTRAQVMSRVAMQMDRDKANAEDVVKTAPAPVWIGAAVFITALMVIPGFIITMYNCINHPEKILPTQGGMPYVN